MKIKIKHLPFIKESAHFIKHETQFRLGELVTEQSHPLTRNLSTVAETNVTQALSLLNRVDYEIPPVFLKLAFEGKLDLPIEKIVTAILKGNKIFFTGCGATGRLSIQMESLWRGFWQDLKRHYAKLYRKINTFLPVDRENRVFSVMAGGDYALIKSVEGFEDELSFGRKQIADLGLTKGDVVFAVTEGGETSFVIGTALQGIESGASVFFVYNNPDTVLGKKIKRSKKIIENDKIVKLNMTTGPQAITGSTRMQAASIETLILSSLLEVAIYKLLSRGLDTNELIQLGFNPELCEIRKLAELSYEIPQTVTRIIPQLAKLILKESKVYAKGGNFYTLTDPYPNRGYTLYIGSKRSGLIILTDTTERSPTFSTPPFRPVNQPDKKSSPVYIAINNTTNLQAWKSVLNRPLRGINWTMETYATLLNKKISRSEVPAIANKDILNFIISGDEVLKFRPIGKGNLVIGVCLDDEINNLNDTTSFLFRTLVKTKKQGGDTALIVITKSKTVPVKIYPYIDHKLIVTEVRYSPLRITQSLVLKLILNMLSTLVMVKLGRVTGNYMTYVTPSNKKLIDRATRLTAQIAQVSYEIANAFLFSVINDTEKYRREGKGIPPVVNISVVRIMLNVDTEAAIKLLLQNNGLLEPTL